MWNKKKNGDIYAVWQTVASVQDANNNIVNFVSIFSDISEKKADDQHIFNLAHFDVLTGLCNRSSFQSQLEKAIAHAHRQHTTLAVIFLDLDNFKHINDASGHAAGDKLLRATGDRLRALVRETDIVARLGGDEFVILINNYANTEALARVSKKIINTLSQPLMLDTTEVVVSASLGISTYPLDGTSTQTLLQNADSAMYQAKSLGRNNYQFFTQDMNRLAKERLMIEADLRKALENGELILHYQPQVHNPSQRIIGCEALVRWNHPQRGLIPPLEFIPIAEESGQIRDIGEWVLNEACAQQARWEAEGFNDLKMSVNISARQFTKQNIVDIVTKCLNRDNINASNLEIEITESAIMENLEDTIKVLAELNAMGVQLAIDDFGTGYSSMAYLKTFPISRLKIDRSFVNDITTDADDAAIVKATISLCKNLHLTVIAEGVETCEQVGFLQDSGCSEMQGYFFGKPVTADEFGALLRGPNYK
jgi:diguanylate cyclase (GGDEF)-like protein